MEFWILLVGILKKKLEKVTEQFSSYMNCSYETTITTRTEPIPIDLYIIGAKNDPQLLGSSKLYSTLS